jgi:hypothetical protein
MTYIDLVLGSLAAIGLLAAVALSYVLFDQRALFGARGRTPASRTPSQHGKQSGESSEVRDEVRRLTELIEAELRADRFESSYRSGATLTRLPH